MPWTGGGGGPPPRDGDARPCQVGVAQGEELGSRLAEKSSAGTTGGDDAHLLLDPEQLPQAALWYVETLGWPIVPLWPIRSTGRCACTKRACMAVGRHPQIRWRQRGPLRNPDEVRSAWGRRIAGKWPGIALVTGPISGIDVIDVDYRDMPDPLAAAAAAFGIGPLTSPVSASSGGGGRHVFVAASGRSTKTHLLGQPIDYKGDGGLVVLAPTLHRSGQPYRWGSSPEELILLFRRRLPEAPSAITEAVPWPATKPSSPNKAAPTRSPVAPGPPLPLPVGLPGWVLDALNDVPVDGRRHQQCYHLAERMVERGLRHDVVRAALRHYRPALDKFGRFAAADADRVIRKLAGKHDHEGRSCHDAHCAHAQVSTALAELDEIRQVVCAIRWIGPGSLRERTVMEELVAEGSKARSRRYVTSERRIARATHLHTETVAAVLRRLERRGWIDVRPNGNDGTTISMHNPRTTLPAPPPPSPRPMGVNARIVHVTPTHPLWERGGVGLEGRQVLEALAELGPATQGEISSRLGLPLTVVGRRLKRLAAEPLGLVRGGGRGAAWMIADGIELTDSSTLDAVVARINDTRTRKGKPGLGEARRRRAAATEDASRRWRQKRQEHAEAVAEAEAARAQDRETLERWWLAADYDVVIVGDEVWSRSQHRRSGKLVQPSPDDLDDGAPLVESDQASNRQAIEGHQRPPQPRSGDVAAASDSRAVPDLVPPAVEDDEKDEDGEDDIRKMAEHSYAVRAIMAFFPGTMTA